MPALSLAEHVRPLASLLAAFDRLAYTALCTELVARLYQSNESFTEAEAADVLRLLRGKRQFDLMQRVGDALLQTGRGSFKIHRQYAQALIDQGLLTAALAVLTDLLNHLAEINPPTPAGDREWAEALGLRGRAYKQLYLNTKDSTNPEVQQHLGRAIAAYQMVYDSASEKHTWHGINVVALAWRAARDGVTLPVPVDVAGLATRILRTIEDRDEDATAWDIATAAEACLALNQPEEALRLVERYVQRPEADAFELGSTLRQLTEVWQLADEPGPSRLLLPILQAELLQREGGQLILDISTLQQQQAEAPDTVQAYERVFGEDAFQTYMWYQRGAARCLAVARVGRELERGLGTGFLVHGEKLHEQLTGQLLLLTNSHVLSDDLNVFGALRSDEALITFEVADQTHHPYQVGRLLWSSPPAVLDTTIVQFADADQTRLQQLAETITPYPVAPRLPLLDGSLQRVYVIGHPAGGTLCLSLQDNLFLDHDEHLLHYRTPTAGGSSGSPVFNQQWELIGIHHKGGPLPRLHDQTGTYAANEGLWIQAIIQGLAEFMGQSTEPIAGEG